MTNVYETPVDAGYSHLYGAYIDDKNGAYIDDKKKSYQQDDDQHEYSYIELPDVKKGQDVTHSVTKEGRPLPSVPTSTEERIKRKRGCKNPPCWGWGVITIGVLLLIAVIVILVYLFAWNRPEDNVPKQLTPTNSPPPTSRTDGEDQHEGSTNEEPSLTDGNERTTNYISVTDSPGAIRNKVAESCEIKLNRFNSLTLSASSNKLPQPASVNTLELCMEKCLGPNGDLLLPQGTTCMAASFNQTSGMCVLSDSIASSQSGKESVFIQVEIYCYPSETPGCNFRFRVVKNRYPLLASNDAEILPATTAYDVAECGALCSLYRIGEPGVSCKGFIYNRRNLSCIIYTELKPSVSSLAFHLSDVIDFYSSSGRACVRCGDLYPDTTSGRMGDGGEQVDGNFTNVFTCKYKCDDYKRQSGSDGKQCYGFDYSRSAGGTCHVHTSEDYTLVPKSGSTNYRREIICTECSEPTRYIATADTGAIGGKVFQGSSFNSPYWCGYLCQGQSVGFNSKTCYGFTFDHQTKLCTLHTNFHFTLGEIGGSPGRDSYRRQFLCRSSQSQPVFIIDRNKSGNGGQIQPQDINSVQRCEDRCWGYRAVTDQPCSGFNFNRDTQRCYIITQMSYSLDNNPNVDNYRLQLA